MNTFETPQTADSVSTSACPYLQCLGCVWINSYLFLSLHVGTVKILSTVIQPLFLPHIELKGVYRINP